ncbi:MAG TPA: response regulator [Nitrospirota bacterium]|nr:response regulator [Nitrospirota bacterium]
MTEPAGQGGGTPGNDRPKRLVIIVDGDNSHLYYTSILLQRLDYNIHAVKSADDALETLHVAEAALVLTEITLAGKDGVELLKEIKRNPRTYATPVVILTASRDPAVKETCLKEGCAAFFQKPVDPDSLYAALQKATESAPRRYIRLNTCLNVIVGDDKAAEHMSVGDYISALSENGMFISSSHPKPIGIEVPITIFLEDSRIKVDGMVRYSFKRGEGPLRTPGMGIKFVRIKPEDQALIRSFVRKEITKGLTDLAAGQTGGTIL